MNIIWDVEVLMWNKWSPTIKINNASCEMWFNDICDLKWHTRRALGFHYIYVDKVLSVRFNAQTLPVSFPHAHHVQVFGRGLLTGEWCTDVLLHWTSTDTVTLMRTTLKYGRTGFIYLNTFSPIDLTVFYFENPLKSTCNQCLINRSIGQGKHYWLTIITKVL